MDDANRTFDKWQIIKVLDLAESTFRLYARELIKGSSPGQGARYQMYDGPEFTMFAIAKILSKRGFPLKEMKPFFETLKQQPKIRPLLNPFIGASIFRQNALILRIHAFFDGVDIFEIISQGIFQISNTIGQFLFR